MMIYQSFFSDHSQKSGRYLGKKKSNNIILTVLRLDKVSNSKSDFIFCVIKENASYRYAEKFRLLQLLAPTPFPKKIKDGLILAMLMLKL